MWDTMALKMGLLAVRNKVICGAAGQCAGSYLTSRPWFSTCRMIFPRGAVSIKYCLEQSQVLSILKVLQHTILLLQRIVE